MKKFNLLIAKYFPAHHPRKGEETGFQTLIELGEKKHTIRENLPYWSRVLGNPQGAFLLQKKQWSGQPYKSPQNHLGDVRNPTIAEITIRGNYAHIFNGDSYACISVAELAKNDGLSEEDFRDWFGKGMTDQKPRAIIFFGQNPYF